mgnify:CR=1 FL=1
MAKCPKCNAKLRLIDWRPECPKCGVNMVYYGMEERLLADAEKAEAEHAKFQKGLDRFKASAIGGPRQIARIILSIIPVAGLFLDLIGAPLAKLSLQNIPFYSEPGAVSEINIGILKVVEFFTDYFDVDGLLAAIQSPVVGKPFIFFALAIVMLALSIVMGILNFGRNFCSSKKKSCVKNVIVSVLSAVLVIVSGVMFGQFASGINAIFPDIITGAMGIGVFITAALHIPVIVVNLLLVKNPIVVKYKELPDYSAEAAEEPVGEAVAAE